MASHEGLNTTAVDSPWATSIESAAEAEKQRAQLEHQNLNATSTNPEEVAQPVLRRKNEATSVSSEHSSAYFRVGATADKNARHRRTMEDVHGCDLAFNGHDDQGIFFILDGHGGKGVADYCGTALPKNISELLSSSPNLPMDQLFTLAFILTDEQLERENLVNSGATVIVSLVRTEVQDGKSVRVLHTANAGDARAILCRGSKAFRLSKDHKATDEEEITRIDASGGMVMGGRVNGVLAVARALGDIHMKEQIVSTPYVSSVILGPEDKFIVLACDGVWDVMSNQEVIDLVSQHTDPKEASLALVRHSIKMGSTDNITAMVVFLQDGQSSSASSTAAEPLPPSLSSQPTEILEKENE